MQGVEGMVAKARPMGPVRTAQAFMQGREEGASGTAQKAGGHSPRGSGSSTKCSRLLLSHCDSQGDTRGGLSALRGNFLTFITGNRQEPKSPQDS